MKRVAIALLVFLALAAPARAQTPSPTPTPTIPLCLMTGTIADIYGQVGEPVRISYQGVQTQNPGSAIIPGASRCSIYTDATGALPTTGVCTHFVQGAKLTVQIGDAGQPIEIQVPDGQAQICQADLAALIQATGNPPGTVSSVTAGTGLLGGTITTSGTIALDTPVSLVNGGTGATSLAAASIPIQGGTITTGHCVQWLSPTSITDSGTPCDTAAGSVTSITAGTGITLSPNPITSTGSVALTVPVAIANGGTGSTTSPAAGNILVASSPTVLAPVAMSGDATIAATGAITVTKTNGTALSGLATASIPLSVANGGTGATTLTASAPLIGNGTSAVSSGTRTGNTTIFATSSGTLTNGHCLQVDASGNVVDAGGACGLSGGPTYPAGAPPQVTGYSASNVSEAETVSGDFTYARGGLNSYVATVTKLNGTVPGGACSANAYVSSISSSAVPTCGPALTGVYAPLTNPAGGQNNYAPLASPTFTGTVTLPAGAQIASPTFTGTLTFPDGSTYTSAGHNNMAALGIGMAADSSPIDITQNQNATSQVVVRNNNAGTNAETAFVLSNGTVTGTVGLTGTGYSAGGPAWPASSEFVSTNGAGGMIFNVSAAAPVYIDLNGYNIAKFNWLGETEPNTNLGNALLALYGTQNGISAAVMYNDDTTSGHTSVQGGYEIESNNGSTQAKWMNTGPYYSGGTAANVTYLSTTSPVGMNFLEFEPSTTFQFLISGATPAYINGNGLVAVNLYNNNAQTNNSPWPVMDQGTWTPDLQFGGANTGITYGVRTGSWVRAGKLVTLQFVTTYNSIGSASGLATMCGLPGQIANVNEGFWTFMDFGNMNFAAGSIFGGYFQSGGNQNCISLGILTPGNGTTQQVVQLSNTNMAAGMNIQGSFTYMMP